LSVLCSADLKLILGLNKFLDLRAGDTSAGVFGVSDNAFLNHISPAWVGRSRFGRALLGGGFGGGRFLCGGRHYYELLLRLVGVEGGWMLGRNWERGWIEDDGSW